MTNGAFSNPLYKNSALASDFYDTPKSTAVVDDYDDDDDAENEITIKVPSNEYRQEFLYLLVFLNSNEGIDW